MLARYIIKLNFCFGFVQAHLVITILGCLTILAFKIFKKLNFGLKIGILKMSSKNSVCFTHGATLQI